MGNFFDSRPSSTEGAGSEPTPLSVAAMRAEDPEDNRANEERALPVSRANRWMAELAALAFLGGLFSALYLSSPREIRQTPPPPGGGFVYVRPAGTSDLIDDSQFELGSPFAPGEANHAAPPFASQDADGNRLPLPIASDRPPSAADLSAASEPSTVAKEATATPFQTGLATIPQALRSAQNSIAAQGVAAARNMRRGLVRERLQKRASRQKERTSLVALWRRQSATLKRIWERWALAAQKASVYTSYRRPTATHAPGNVRSRMNASGFRGGATAGAAVSLGALRTMRAGAVGGRGLAETRRGGRH